MEVSLNTDFETHLQETHQLVVPPVQCIPADKLKVLPFVGAKHVHDQYDHEEKNLSKKELSERDAVYQMRNATEEYDTCAATVEDIARKAHVLVECVYSALSEYGTDEIGQLFSGPISLHPDDTHPWGYRVHGSYVAEGVDLSVETADFRKLFRQPHEHSGDVWLYPAPHSHDDVTRSQPQDEVRNSSATLPLLCRFSARASMIFTVCASSCRQHCRNIV